MKVAILDRTNLKSLIRSLPRGAQLPPPYASCVKCGRGFSWVKGGWRHKNFALQLCHGCKLDFMTEEEKKNEPACISIPGYDPWDPLEEQKKLQKEWKETWGV